MRVEPNKHKRIPSFMSHRWTQSFRGHTKNLNTIENLPLVFRLQAPDSSEYLFGADREEQQVKIFGNLEIGFVLFSHFHFCRRSG